MLQNLALLFLGIVIGLAFFYFIGRLLAKRPEGSEFNSTTYTDAEIENILKRNGYVLKEKGKKAPLTIYLDGKSHLNMLVADFTAQKGNKRYVVFVRTEKENDPLSQELRQKLIELDYAFDPSGILVIAPASGSISVVSFEVQRPEGENFMRFFIPLFIVLLVIGLVSLLFLVKLI
jgi:hypothetical protein